jgi:hypothetical protein
MNTAQLYRIIYSGWDFQQALSALTFLLEEIDYEKSYTKIEWRKFRCYEVNAIISFCRPFEASRGKTTLSLKAMGIRLENSEKNLKKRILELRRKIVAHSDEENMHFRCKTHDMDIKGTKVVLTEFVFDEFLHLSESEAYDFYDLLQKLNHLIARYNIELAQNYPNLFNFYKQPSHDKA